MKKQDTHWQIVVFDFCAIVSGSIFFSALAGLFAQIFFWAP